MQSIRRVLSSISITDFSFVLVSKHFFLTSGLLVKGKWQNLRDNFRRERTKISNRTTGSEAPDDSALSAWNHYKQLLFLVDVFSSRKLQNYKPVSLPCQATLLSQLTTIIKIMITEWRMTASGQQHQW